jgi:hypothetical protein
MIMRLEGGRNEVRSGGKEVEEVKEVTEVKELGEEI